MFEPPRARHSLPPFSLQLFLRFFDLAIPCLNAALLHSICRGAGVHLYSDQDLRLEACKHFLALTANESGFDGTIQFPSKGNVYDIFARQIVATNTTSVEFAVPPLTTVFYFLGNAKELEAFANTCCHAMLIVIILRSE